MIIKFTHMNGTWLKKNQNEKQKHNSVAHFGDFLGIPSSLKIHDLVPLAQSISTWNVAKASTRVIDRSSIHTEKMT